MHLETPPPLAGACLPPNLHRPRFSGNFFLTKRGNHFFFFFGQKTNITPNPFRSNLTETSRPVGTESHSFLDGCLGARRCPGRRQCRPACPREGLQAKGARELVTRADTLAKPSLPP